MESAEAIQTFIEDFVRPRVQSDGGEIRFLSLKEDVLTVKIQGECSRCPVSGGCFSEWLIKEIKIKFGMDLKLERVVEKPYFWNF